MAAATKIKTNVVRVKRSELIIPLNLVAAS